MKPKKPHPADMSGEAALAAAKKAAQLRQLTFTRHASRDRMPERSAQAHDVRSAVLSATTATWRADDQSWRLSGGVDLDGEALSVAVAIEGHVVRVITVF